MHFRRTSVLLVVAALMFGCASPEDARLALEERDLAYTEEYFVQSVRSGDTVAAGLFLDAGMNPNTADAHGVTVLMLAAAVGDLKAVKLLLRAGANPQVRNEAGWTALTYAERNGWTEVAALLKEKGAGGSQEEFWAELEKQGVFYDPANFLTVARSRPELILTYVGAGADPNAHDQDGVTPLMLAAAADRTEVVRGLLSLEVDVNARDAGGWTALTYARISGADRSAELLIQAGGLDDQAVSQQDDADAPLAGGVIP